ncbi:MAG: DUF4058 family protein [Stenomitos frigidus ULC029]
MAIADDLTEHLSQQYRVAIEQRTYLSSGDDSLLVGVPDVSVVAKRTEENSVATATMVAPESITVTVPMAEEVQERYLEVREVATGAVITASEIFSPKNKRAGEGRQAYTRKRHQVLASLTHLVEIDLLRGGQPLPILGTTRSDYRILVSCSHCRLSAQLYAFNMRQEIPSFPVPLKSGEAELLLPLQGVFEKVYERGRYYLAIDYTTHPQPPLAPKDATWADVLLKENRLEARLLKPEP